MWLKKCPLASQKTVKTNKFFTFFCLARGRFFFIFLRAEDDK
jgi:hypothetical protein